jgi:hypothetical protein
MQRIQALFSFDPQHLSIEFCQLSYLKFEKGQILQVVHKQNEWYYAATGPALPFSRDFKVGFVPCNYFKPLPLTLNDAKEISLDKSVLEDNQKPVEMNEVEQVATPPITPEHNCIELPSGCNSSTALLGSALEDIHGVSPGLSMVSGEVVSISHVLMESNMVVACKSNGTKGIVLFSKLKVWNLHSGDVVQTIQQANASLYGSGAHMDVPKRKIAGPRVSSLLVDTSSSEKCCYSMDIDVTPRLRSNSNPTAPSFAQSSRPKKIHHRDVRSRTPDEYTLPKKCQSTGQVSRSTGSDSEMKLQSPTVLRGTPGYLLDPTESFSSYSRRPPNTEQKSPVKLLCSSPGIKAEFKNISVLSGRRVGPARYEYIVKVQPSNGNAYEIIRQDAEFYQLEETLNAQVSAGITIPALPIPMTLGMETNYKQIMCLPVIMAQREKEFNLFCSSLVELQDTVKGAQIVSKFVK